MKKIYILFVIFTQLFLAGNLNAQCTADAYGEYGNLSPVCGNGVNGAWATSPTDCWNGEYSIVNITAGSTYQFQTYRTSNNDGRYATITTTANVPIVWGNTSTTTSISWTATFTGSVRFYTHLNNTCGTSTQTATRRVRCSTPPPPPSPTSITASATSICAGAGTNVTLTANGASGTVHWFVGLCGTTGSFATGNATVVSPTATTTYYARNFDGTAWSTNCASITIVVNNPPTVVSIGASPQTICAGQQTNLTSSANYSSTIHQAQNETDFLQFITNDPKWVYDFTSNVGSTSPEIFFNWTPSSTGLFWAQFGSIINATGYTNLNFQFKHFLADFSGGYTLRLQTSPDGVTWTDRWTLVNPTGNVGPATVNVPLTALNNSLFFYRFAFDGNSFNTDGWWIDDISITGTPPAISYAWSSTPAGFTSNSQNTSASPIVNTNYTVTATANGCSTSSTVTVIVNELPAVPTVSAGTPAICAPGTTTLNANDMAPGGRVINFTNPAMAQTSSTLYTAAPNTFTFELWVNPTATRATTNELNGNTDINGTGGSGQRYAVIPAHGSTNAGAGISVGTNGISVFEHGDGYMPSLLVYDAPITGWTHIAVVYNAKTPRLYVNGSLVKTGLTSVRPNVYPSAGTGTYYGEYLGSLDNYRVWSVARTQAQILADMHLKNPTNNTGLIAHYTFDGNNYNAALGTNITNNNGTFSNANHYTYAWSNGPNLPAASNNEAQTTGSINTPGTHNYVVVASANGCSSPNSVNVPVVVDAPSVAPTSITGGGTYCHGNTITLTPNGGTLGTGATYQWFTGSCNGTLIGTGATITVQPTTNTTYFVNTSVSGTGMCPSTTCVNTAVSLPTTGNTLSQNNEVATCIVNQNNFIHFFHSSGRLLASINSNGQDLGNVTVTSYAPGAPIDVPACNNTSPNWISTAMGRHWVITPQFQPASAVTVRLPFSQAEFDAFQAQANSNLNTTDDIASPFDIELSKYSGSLNVDNNPYNNCLAAGGGANTTRHAQLTNGLVNTYLPGFGPTSNYVDFTINSFSEFWLYGSTINSPLPVELTDAEVSCDHQNKLISINWTTQSETNSLKFEVEKTYDYLNWEYVGYRDAAGNSSTPIYYGIQDEYAAQEVYYRLKQIDQNGDFEYFNLGSVNCFTFGDLNVFPNPSKGIVTIRYASFEEVNDAAIEIVDVYGKLLYNKLMTTMEGTNEFVIDLSNFADATYFIHVRTPQGVLKPVKIVKMN